MTQAHYKHLLPSEHNGCKTARAGNLKNRLLAKVDSFDLSLYPEECLYRRVPITELDHEGLLLVVAILFEKERERTDKILGRTLDA